MNLEGRRALVTGAGRGIGRAIVEAFVEEGAYVLGVARTQGELDELNSISTSVSTARVDVLDRNDVDELDSLVRTRFGGLDILVNNAGVWMQRDFQAYTRDEWDLTIGTNLTGVFDVTQALLPLLLESDSARLINIAAIDGEVGFPRLVAQCASKSGLIGFTRALAKELWERPITVNAICPATVDERVGYGETPARVPAPEQALPWDVARAAVYLASAQAVRITGTSLDVHGVGFLAS